MAITTIHPITATVGASIKYITNAHKTEELLYVDSFACGVETAAFDFECALKMTSRAGSDKGHLAYHLIQSFKPGEVKAEEAHQIGKELADKVLEGKYSYVIATHLDRKHLHNHIIFCAADNIDHKKYNDCKRSYYHIRELNDELCSNHHLSVIKEQKGRGKKYYEWMADQTSEGSWKTQIRRTINEMIRAAKSYEDFIRRMRELGYEIKGENLDGSNGKYIQFRPPGKERFVRGYEKSLGAKYTRERIKERIDTKMEHRREITRKFLEENQRRMIDTSQERFRESAGLKHWADKENLKTAAKIVSDNGNHVEIARKIADLEQTIKENYKAQVEAEHRRRDRKDVIFYGEQYLKYKETYDYYMNCPAKDKERIFRINESKIIAFQGAANRLKAFGIDLKKFDEKLYKSYVAQDNADIREINQCETARKQAQKEKADLEAKLKELDMYMGRSPEHEKKQTQDQSRQKRKNHNVSWDD
ncbi:MAG: relaxase/mobilization nuclease domain-containing protein [Lachnospiraceae bacterium]|nr:relaxase/mobilization nuclease domain-containing protein [Lachnospiraceae bacterium]